MRQKSVRAGICAVALAIVIGLTCILCFVAGREPLPSQGDSSDAAATNTDTVTAPPPVASYDFTSADFDSSEWTEVKNGTNSDEITVAPGVGVTLPGVTNGTDNEQANRFSYAVKNPLKGRLTDSFAVSVDLTVTKDVNPYATIFGFNGTHANPYQGKDRFFLVGSNGLSLHLSNTAAAGTTAYYDINVDWNQSYITLNQPVKYLLVVSREAITIYVDNVQRISYAWNATGDTTAYSYDTVSFINEAEWFNIGMSAYFWDNAGLTVRNVTFYDNALPTYIALQNRLNELETEFSLSYYNTEANGWEAAHAAYTQAITDARATDITAVSQSHIDAINDAYDALQAFRRTENLTDGIVSAFTLDSEHGGSNLVAGKTGEVLFMSGENAPGTATQTEELTSAERFITYQGMEGAKLFDDAHLAGENTNNPYADRGATSCTMGLSIPSDAFGGVTSETGLTITANIYFENFYSGAFGRVFQLGEYDFATANSGQIFVAVNGNTACDVGESVIIPNSTNAGQMLARQWCSVTISLDPLSDLISVYISGYQLNEANAIRYLTNRYTVKADHAVVTTLINAITADSAENWIGRSFWDTADTSVVGAARNLSIYNRALLPEEVSALHATDDLTTLVTGA